MDVQVAQDFLTSAEVERLRETEELAEQIPDEEPLRAQAWEDLRGWGMTDLKTLKEMSEQRRRNLTDEYRKAYRSHTPSNSGYWSSDASKEEEMRRLAKWRASEPVTEFYRTVLPLDAKIVRLRVRSEVAQELLERHLLGREIPDTLPGAEEQMVTPLSEYDPSPTASKILRAVAESQNERENLREAKDMTRVLKIALDEAGEKPLSPLRQDMKRKDVHGTHWPSTPDELVDLAVQKTNLNPKRPNVS